MRRVVTAAIGCLLLGAGMMPGTVQASAVPSSGIAPARSFATPMFEVEGFHLGDTIESVNQRLATRGFAAGEPAYPSCDRDLASLVEELRSEGRKEAEPPALDCTEIHRRGKQAITAQYLLGPGGYVLSTLIFDYPATDTAGVAVGKLSKRYGRPRTVEGNLRRWYAGSSPRQPYLQFGQVGRSATLTMTGSDQMSDHFYAEFNNRLSR